jgi:orotidine-5'-phosphate decarboxylase
LRQSTFYRKIALGHAAGKELKMLNLKPAERLFVSADECCSAERSRQACRLAVVSLARALKGTGAGVTLGANLISYGVGIVDEINECKVPCWVDLGHLGNAERMEHIGAFLFEMRPHIVTVPCTASLATMAALKRQFAGAEAVLGVADLFGMNEAEVVGLYNCDPIAAVIAMVRRAERAGLDGFVVGPQFAPALSRIGFGLAMNVMDVRPTWSIGASEGVSRIMTPAEAFALRAERIVVGMPIARAEKPQVAAMNTIEEVVSAFPEDAAAVVSR